MTNPNNSVGTNAAYAGRTSVNAFNDDLAAYSRGILNGWACSPDSGLTVVLGGNGTIRDVAIAQDNAGNKTTINNISGAPVAVTLNAAPGANSRIDAIVAYVDNPPQGSATIADNYEACGLIAVNGTAAVNPVAPTENVIRSAITADGASGATAYYVVLATAKLASGTTDISADNITAGEDSKLAYKNTSPDTGTVLWDNPSPTSNFTSQTVTLSDDLSNYKHLEVVAIDNATATTPTYTSEFFLIGGNHRLKALTAGVPLWRAMASTTTGTRFEFGMATWYSSYNSTATATSAQYLIPQRVIGYKW